MGQPLAWELHEAEMNGVRKLPKNPTLLSVWSLNSPLELVNPEYTSQTCKCGHQAKANRNDLKFRRKECGHICHADLNGAIHVAKAISDLAA
ncbi:Putative transposase DNA-binding domain-containing protein [Seinonella peptonophila]|uniref:Putative transposase DNA-binding domain-containing protein n=1 Tax=Seinonella peptonophila TaxID=112248 RepID=A0A1M5B345_9BACL|nr:Putative transposase DNA-binding domain-containing protein [Seinonella peptonophila]